MVVGNCSSVLNYLNASQNFKILSTKLTFKNNTLMLIIKEIDLSQKNHEIYKQLFAKI